jgi:hypothetical protein
MAGPDAEVPVQGPGRVVPDPDVLRRGQQAFWVPVTLGVRLGFGPGERVMMR